VLQAQDDVVTQMKEGAGDALLRVTKDANGYKKVLKGLIVQVGLFLICMHFLFRELVGSEVQGERERES
jgi:hypothetical protein